jgi:peptidoglycan/LPS O-acetylase OafA/YrhL
VVEVSFYVVLPLIGWAIVRARGRWRALALCGLLVGIGLAWTAAGVSWHWPLTAMTTLPVYLPVFACGIAAAVLAHGRRPGRWAVAALAIAGAAAVGLNAAWHGDGTGFVGHVVLDLPAAAGFAAIVAAVALRPARLLGCAPLRWLGSISYGVYLWHMPVLVWLRIHGHLPPEDALGGVFRVLLPTVAIATASWLLVERPIMRRVGRRRRAHPDPGPRRPQPVPAPA